MRLQIISSRMRRTSADPRGVMHNHHFAPVIRGVGTHDITKIFEPRDESTGGGGGVPHFLRDGRHRQHLLLIEIGEEEELREGNIPWSEFFREAENEAALHLHDDVGETFGVDPKFIGFR